MRVGFVRSGQRRRFSQSDGQQQRRAGQSDGPYRHASQSVLPTDGQRRRFSQSVLQTDQSKGADGSSSSISRGVDTRLVSPDIYVPSQTRSPAGKKQAILRRTDTQRDLRTSSMVWIGVIVTAVVIMVLTASLLLKSLNQGWQNVGTLHFIYVTQVVTL